MYATYLELMILENLLSATLKEEIFSLIESILSN